MSLRIFILSFHIAGGIISIFLCCAALFIMIRRASEYRTFLSRSIAVAAVVEVLSGMGLLMLQAVQGSLLHFCVRLVVYLVLMGGVEGLLYITSRRESSAYAE